MTVIPTGTPITLQALANTIAGLVGVSGVNVSNSTAVPTGATLDTIANLFANRIKKNGDAMTGPLTLPADPVSALHSATKQYVDNLPNGPIYSIAASGAVGDGVTDDAAKINTWLATLPSPSTVIVPKIYLIAGANLSIPTGVSIIGAGSPQSTTVTHSLSGAGGFCVATNRTIIPGDRTRLQDLLIYQQGLPSLSGTANDAAVISEVATWPANGIGLTIQNDGNVVEHCAILGFATGIRTKGGRILLRHLWLDNYVCIHSDSMGDICWFREIHCAPFWSLGATVQGGTSGGWARPCCGLYLDTVSPWIVGLFTFMFSQPVVMLNGLSYIEQSASEWHDAIGNGVTGTIGWRNLGGCAPSIRQVFHAGDARYAISFTGGAGATVDDFNAPSANTGVYCGGQSAVPSTLTISSPTIGATITATLTSSSISGSPLALTYTCGSTNATNEAKGLCKLINLNQALTTAGVYANYSGGVVSFFNSQDITVSVGITTTGTITTATSTGTARAGSFGILSNINVGPGSAAVQFGDTNATTLGWSLAGIQSQGSTVFTVSLLSCPAGQAQQDYVTISGVNFHPRTGTYSWGTVAGTDANGSWTMPTGTVTSQTFVFSTAMPWVPKVQATVSDPTINVAVTSVTTSGFTVGFSANAASKTVYYKVEL